MTINVIYDSRHPERYEQIMGEFKTQGITDFLIWDCAVLPSVVESINTSHKQIVRDAKDNGLPYCCIMEDDCFFPNPKGWEYFLSQMPKEFDLYLWGTYLLPREQKMVNGFQLYVVADKFYDKYLSAPDNEHIDGAMNALNGDYHFCYPFPALQRVKFSRNNMGIANYNILLTDNDVYK